MKTHGIHDGRRINHNETLVRSHIVSNHNETLVRGGRLINHNETLLLHDLDLPEAAADEIKGGAFGDIKGESQNDGHKDWIEVSSWKLSGASDRPR